MVIAGVTSPYTYNPGGTGTHQYRVRANNASCTGSWSAATAAADGNATPSSPSAPVVTDLDPCAQSGVRIAWGTVTGATAYDLQVDDSTVVAGVTSPFTYNPGDTAPHSYRVRARNASCTGAWSAATPLADASGAPATPSAPSVTDPDICLRSGVQVTWAAVPGATAYDLQVDGGTVIQGVTSPYTYVPGNADPHTCRVRSRNASCAGAWSEATGFSDGPRAQDLVLCDGFEAGNTSAWTVTVP